MSYLASNNPVCWAAPTDVVSSSLGSRGFTAFFQTLDEMLSDLFVRYARKAGLTDVTFHCLRNTYISRLAVHCTTSTVMALARHRDYRTTRRYVKVDGDHLRHAVENLTPAPPIGHETVTEIVTTSDMPS